MSNMLLSVSTNGSGTTNNWIAMGVGAVIIVIAIIFITLSLKQRENHDAMLKEFLNLMANRIKEAIFDAIKKIDPDDLKGNLPEVYYEITNAIYNAVFDMCYEYIDIVAKDHTELVISVLKNILTKEKIKEYVDVILDNNKEIQEKITEIINIVMKKQVEEQEKEDQKATEELEKDGVIEDMDKYIEEGNDINKDKEPEGKMLDANFKPIEEKINPPKDEEDDVIKDDGTIEVVDDVNVADKLNDEDDDNDNDDGK